MSNTETIGLFGAAQRIGVPVRVLREAVRSGRIPAPPQIGATAALPGDWVAAAEAAVAASPETIAAAPRQKVPPFARYQGTSAWRKYPVRVRAYTRFMARAKAAAAAHV